MRDMPSVVVSQAVPEGSYVMIDGKRLRVFLPDGFELMVPWRVRAWRRVSFARWRAARRRAD